MKNAIPKTTQRELDEFVKTNNPQDVLRTLVALGFGDPGGRACQPRRVSRKPGNSK